MEWRSTISASWLQVQLPELLCLETLWFLPMEFIFNLGTQVTAAGDVGSYYTYAGFLVMGNGDGERNTLPGVRDRPLGTTVVGLRASAMENGEGSLPPASRAEYSGACLFANWGKDNGQWSQWMEQRFLGRYTVIFEGRSWL
jgi:hypothetical protein